MSEDFYFSYLRANAPLLVPILKISRAVAQARDYVIAEDVASAEAALAKVPAGVKEFRAPFDAYGDVAWGVHVPMDLFRVSAYEALLILISELRLLRTGDPEGDIRDASTAAEHCVQALYSFLKLAPADDVRSAERMITR